ncbi:hypothetical protein GCM10009602_57490 [Nocardiopsis tropica]
MGWTAKYARRPRGLPGRRIDRSGRASRLASGVLLTALALTGCGGSEPTNENAGAEREDYIEQESESSGPVGFDASPQVTLTGDDTWELQVVGSTRSEDGAGSTRRTDYTCTVVNNSGDWVVVDLETTER